MPTTNPIPSSDPSDLLFNAQKLDETVNSASLTFTDRLGAPRKTMAGIQAAFDAQLADAESDLNVYRADAAASAAEALGYLQTYRATSYGAYASEPATDPLGNPPTVGDEYFNTTSNLLKRFNGATWQASDINTANLAAPSGSSLVGYQAAGIGSVSRTSQDKMRDAVSVFDFMTSAQISDVKSNAASITMTTAIQSAINAAASLGKSLFSPNGTYLTGKLQIPSNLYLFGENKEKTVIKLAAGSNSNLLENADLTNGNSNIVVAEMTLDHNYSAQTIAAGNNDIGNAAYFKQCNNVIVKDCIGKNSWQAAVHFLNCTDSRVVDSVATATAKDTSLGLAAFYCENSDRVLFDRNWVYSVAGSAIGSIGGADVICSNNVSRVTGATAFTINSLRGRVQNNTCDTTTFANGITCGHSADVSGTVISGNIVRNAANSGIAFSTCANMVVSGNFIEGCGGSAINFASGSASRVTITGNTINANGKIALGSGTAVSVKDITVVGNTITNCSRVTYFENTDGFLFSSNAVSECATYGLYFAGTISRVLATDNTFTNTAPTAIPAITMTGAVNSAFSRNRIKNFSFQGFTISTATADPTVDHSGNQWDNGGIQDGMAATSLPVAGAEWRGRILRWLGPNIGVNQADRLYMCKLLGDGSYSWVQVI